MELTSAQTTVLGDLMVDVAQDATSRQLREHLGERLLRLLKGDQFASYVWQPQGDRFSDRVIINMSAANLDAYEAHFQFHDPITRRLQRFRRATFVEEVMPRAELQRTEFFNDFLARDGLHHGLNHFAWVGPRNLGDLRIWRSAGRPDFTESERLLLDLVGRAFTAALRRLAPAESAAPSNSTHSTHFTGPLGILTPREREVAEALAQGKSDEEVGALLGMSFGTVRTHVGHIFDKLAISSRTQLAHLVWSAHRG